MDASRLEQVIEVLRQEEARLQTTVSELEKNAQGVRTLLDRVRAGIAALTGKGSGKAAKKMGQGAEWLTVEDTVGFIVQVLKGRDAQPEDALREEVGKLAVQAGKSRSGLNLRFTKALQDKRFRLGPDGWQLTEPVAQRTASAVQS